MYRVLKHILFPKVIAACAIAPAAMSVFTKELDDFVSSMLADPERGGMHWEQFVDKLAEAGLCDRDVECDPDFVAVHEKNRSRFGLGCGAMNIHGAGIVAQGFSWKKSSDVMAIRFNGDSATWNFNEQLVELSQGMLPPLRMIKLISIGGTNTNGFLRALRHQSITVTKYKDLNDRWDKTTLCAKDEALARAQAHGLKWTVLDHRVVDRWPDIVQYGIAVMNARSSAGISETEGMLAIYEAVEAELTANKEINWEFALQVRFLFCW